MSQAYLFRAGAGVPGEPTRVPLKDIQTGLLDTAAAPGINPTAFGVPVKYVSPYFQAIQAGDVAADFYGILVRLAPSIAGDTQESLTSGTPNANLNQGIMDNGYVNVLCTVGSPVRGQPVYMRVVENLPNLVGALEATSVPGENVALVGVVWAVDGLDSNNVTEIELN